MDAYEFAIIAVLAGSIVKILNKSLVSNSVSPYAIYFFYTASSTLITLIFTPKGLPYHFSLSTWALLFGAGAVWTIAGVFNLKAYEYISASDGEVFSKLSLVLITLGGVFLYDETLSSGALFGFALIVSTIFLNVTKVQFTWSKGIFYALIATTATGVAVICDKYLSTKVPASQLTLISYALPAVFLFFRDTGVVKTSIKALQLNGWKMLFIPFLGTLRYYCIISAFAIGELTKISIILETAIVLVFVGEFLLLREKQSLATRSTCCALCLTGALLVCG